MIDDYCGGCGRQADEGLMVGELRIFLCSSCMDVLDAIMEDRRQQMATTQEVRGL